MLGEVAVSGGIAKGAAAWEFENSQKIIRNL